jgi:hypothetical protein
MVSIKSKVVLFKHHRDFLSRANNLHLSIKFTHEISNTTISFLDTSSSLSEGVLSTDLYSKPTDTNQYLFPSSFVTPSFQIIFKLTQSFFQRFVGGANSPDSKSLTVWYALSRKVGEGSGDRLRSPAGPEQNPGWGARGANPESSWVLRI